MLNRLDSRCQGDQRAERPTLPKKWCESVTFELGRGRGISYTGRVCQDSNVVQGKAVAGEQEWLEWDSLMKSFEYPGNIFAAV